MDEELKKVLFVYKIDEESPYEIESLWAKKKGDYYEIKNIPFMAKNIAWGDLISVEKDEDVLYFDKLIKPSGHSVIRIIFSNVKNIPKVGRDLVKMGCTWEGSHLPKLISVDIPPSTEYKMIKEYLNKKVENGEIDYQEACLGWKVPYGENKE